MTIKETPPAEIVEKLKEEYDEIFQVSYEDKFFIYRKISRIEYKEITEEGIQNEAELEETILRRCLLYPDGRTVNFEDYLAGTPTALYESIVLTSGLYPDQIEESLSFFRNQMQDIDYQIDLVIREIFPEFSLYEMSKWEMNKTLYYYSRAEWALRNLKGIQLNLFSSEEERQAYEMQQLQQMQQAVPQQQQVQNQEPSMEEIAQMMNQQHQEEFSDIEEEHPYGDPNEITAEEIFGNKEKPKLEEIPEKENIEEPKDTKESSEEPLKETGRLTDMLDEDKEINGLTRKEVRERMKNFFLSDEQVLKLHGQAAASEGRQPATSMTKIDSRLPEAAWFQTYSKLTGEDY